MYAGVFLQLHGNLRNNVIVLRNQFAFRVFQDIGDIR